MTLTNNPAAVAPPPSHTNPFLQSAALGLAISGALALGYSNIFVTAPSPENLRTLFEFVFKVSAAPPAAVLAAISRLLIGAAAAMFPV